MRLGRSCAMMIGTPPVSIELLSCFFMGILLQFPLKAAKYILSYTRRFHFFCLYLLQDTDIHLSSTGREPWVGGGAKGGFDTGCMRKRKTGQVKELFLSIQPVSCH
ncbi:hypothetical protein DFH27DRAFT_295800 [Peziza echinospora]|nr:hypothetical protein DFH27DRAFT_295800 [Peziza echinospora]